MESLTGDEPRSIGGYALRARLGEGGFGQVYLGLSPGGRAVAVKVLRPELGRDQGFLQRFRLEVAAARQVNGFYTAQVVAAGLDDRPPWVATAFVPGPPLNEAVEVNGPLPALALWRLLAGLVEALQAIHDCGLVHRDLKPANVLLAADGPRVIDFGISKAVDATAMTSTGLVIGTPSFMAPEQAEGRAVSRATDVFALGCVLAYAATGKTPFASDSAASILYRIVHGQPTLDGIAPQLRAAIEPCLAKDPAARPELSELAKIGRDGPGGGSAESPLAFWPLPLGQLIRDYHMHLDAAWMDGARGGSAGPPSAPPPMAAPRRPAGYTTADRTQTRQNAPGVARPAGRPYGTSTPSRSRPPTAQPGRYAPEPVRIVAPGSVNVAVTLMRVAAVLGGIAALLSGVSSPASAATAASHSSPAEIGFIALLAVLALWLLLANGARNGRFWARNVSTLLTLAIAWPLLYAGVGHGDWGAIARDSVLVVLLMWITGCAAVVLLWFRPSSQYFRLRQRARLSS